MYSERSLILHKIDPAARSTLSACYVLPLNSLVVLRELAFATRAVDGERKTKVALAWS